MSVVYELLSINQFIYGFMASLIGKSKWAAIMITESMLKLKFVTWFAVNASTFPLEPHAYYLPIKTNVPNVARILSSYILSDW